MDAGRAGDSIVLQRGSPSSAGVEPKNQQIDRAGPFQGYAAFLCRTRRRSRIRSKASGVPSWSVPNHLSHGMNRLP